MMAARHIEEIRSLPLFENTSDESFELLVRGAYVQNFPPHTELITEGDMADFFHIVSSGWVELFCGWKDRETSMFFLSDNDTFILAATIKDRPYLMSARTVEKSRIIMIPSEDIRAAFQQDTDFARSIVTELAGCYREAVKNSKNIKLRTASERLANFLLSRYHENSSADGFDLELDKRRIASYLGMTPENLSRAFASLRNHSVVVDGNHIHIQDPEKLTAYAHPTPLIDH